MAMVVVGVEEEWRERGSFASGLQLPLLFLLLVRYRLVVCPAIVFFLDLVLTLSLFLRISPLETP